MKHKLVALMLAVLFCEPMIAGASGNPFIHKFEIWGGQKTQEEKVDFLIGITNGVLMGNPDKYLGLLTCLDANVSYHQAVAMVDKYYKEHPELWAKPVALEVLTALTVADGPCSTKLLSK